MLRSLSPRSERTRIKKHPPESKSIVPALAIGKMTRINTVTRRDFLQKAAAATAIGVVGARGANAAVAPSDRLSIAVVGLGGIGRHHATQFGDLFNVRTICDLDKLRLQAYQNDFTPDARATADYREAIQADDVDAVFVCTPDHWHTKIAIEALHAGKDVYCEKPLTLTIDEGRQLREAGRRSARSAPRAELGRTLRKTQLRHRGGIGTLGSPRQVGRPGERSLRTPRHRRISALANVHALSVLCLPPACECPRSGRSVPAPSGPTPTRFTEPEKSCRKSAREPLLDLPSASSSRGEEQRIEDEGHGGAEEEELDQGLSSRQGEGARCHVAECALGRLRRDG